MPDLYMDVDIALSEVPVNILSLTDDTDFKTRETAITYNQAGMDLVWNFITTGGAYTQTAVTPTTDGNYDWSNQGDGMYSIEIPASGGASINNDTEGVGWFSGFCTGVLPWRGPTIGFRAAGINNLLIDSAYSATRGLTGTALPAAAADAAGGLPISGAGGLALDTKLANTHEVTAARMGALTDWINGGRLDAILDIIAGDVVNIDGEAMRGTDSANTVVPDAAGTGATPADVAQALVDIHLDHLLAANYDPASKPGVATALFNELIESDGGVSRYTENALEQAPSGTGASAATIADAVWDEAIADHQGAGSFGLKNQNQVPSEALNDYKADVTNLDAAISTRSSHSASDVWEVATRTLTSFGTLVTDIWASATRTLTSFGSLIADIWASGTRTLTAGTKDTEIDEIKVKTDGMGISKNVAWNNFKFLMVLSSDHYSPGTGLTVSATIQQDGGSFAAADNSVVEVGNGVYRINWTQAEMNADNICFRFTASGADQRIIMVQTE